MDGLFFFATRSQESVVRNQAWYVIVSEGGPYKCPSESNDLAFAISFAAERLKKVAPGASPGDSEPVET